MLPPANYLRTLPPASLLASPPTPRSSLAMLPWWCCAPLRCAAVAAYRHGACRADGGHQHDDCTLTDACRAAAPQALLSRVDFLGEMSDFVHSGALSPLIPPAPFSHKGRRGSLGVLMPETRDGTQRLSKKSPPVRHAPCLSRFPRKRGNREGWGASRRPRCTRREAGVSAADYAIGNDRRCRCRCVGVGARHAVPRLIAIGNDFSRRRALCGTGACRNRAAQRRRRRCRRLRHSLRFQRAWRRGARGGVRGITHSRTH